MVDFVYPKGRREVVMKNSMLITVVLAIFVCVKPCYAQLDDKALAETFFDKGVLAYDLDDYYPAISYFEETLKYNPDHKGAQRYLQQSKVTKIKELYAKAFNYITVDKEYFNAEETFIEILKIDPTQRKAQIYLTRKVPRLIKNLTKDLTPEQIAQIRKELLGDFVPQGVTRIGSQRIGTRVFLAEQLASPVDVILGPSEEIVEYVVEESARPAPRERVIVYPDGRVEEVYPRIELIQQTLDSFEIQPVVRGDTVEVMNIYNIDVDEVGKIIKKIEKIRHGIHQDIAYLTAKPEVVSYARDEKLHYIAVSDALFDIENERRMQKEAIRSRWPIIRPKVSYPKRYREQTYVSPAASGYMEVPKDYPAEGVVGVLYDQAFSYYQDKNLPMAKDYFQKVLLLDPGERLAKKFLYNINRGMIPLR